MKKYITLFLKLFSLSWVGAMQYRTNFMMWLFIDFLWSWMDLIFFMTLINTTHVIGTWNIGQSVVVIGLFRILAIIVWGWLYPSFSKFVHDIREGRLDLLLVKPFETQFAVSVQKFSFSLLSSLFTGTGFIVLGFTILGYTPDIKTLSIFLWMFVVATLLIYSCYFLIVSFALFFERIDNIHHIFPAIYDGSRYPKEIYAGLIQRALTTVFPIALMISVPANTLFGNTQHIPIVTVHVMTILFLILGRLVWKQGLKKYSSASS